MHTILAFDIETIPDIDSAKHYLELDALDDKSVAEIMFTRARERSGSDFLALHLHKIAAISITLKRGNQVTVWSLGDESSSEKEIVQRFFDGIEKYQPTLVSWNGSGFDLPVLHYRALLHGIQAPVYWEVGDNVREAKYNNYLGRFHWRHIDLMDVLAAYQMRGRAPLDEIAVMLGFPGKLGMSGDKVWGAFLDGKLKEIREYCETDTLNTYLVYCRFELMRGNLDMQGYELECQRVRDFLQESGEPHFLEFLNAWTTR
ncbi:MAG: 3'-5' exonuclease [Gammaproteobacteria bacterium]|nr:3'-5' exonuclease [Gammaproteobacteria bacterium]NNC96558.1 3'-5' exonuclease [Gammaproteobacteria bacterium]NNM12917.1 3'-5' exonuclease [Gammaproteobacteria bacterium]